MSDPKSKFIRYIKRVGAGSMLISIIIHVIIIGTMTVWVVSTVQPQRKALFKGGDNAGSPVQHPIKMSNTQPHLDTLTKRLSVDTPNSAVALPDLPSIASSSSSGPSLMTTTGAPGATGGLKGPLMPAFGFKEAQPGGTLSGRLYDLKQTPELKPHPKLPPKLNDTYVYDIVADFLKANCNRSKLSSYFTAPDTLYNSQIFIPIMQSDEGVKAFGVEKIVKSQAWIAHYRGKVSPPVSGSFRFIGFADDVLAVRINGQVILDASFAGQVTNPKRSHEMKFSVGGPYPTFFGGKWQWMKEGFYTRLEAGKFYDMDIVIGECGGGWFDCMLLFEQEGVTYKKDANGNPILPVFRVADSKLDPEKYSIPFMTDGQIWRALPPPKD